MRVDINLATRPYEDAREFWARWGLGVGLLAALTLVLLTFAVRGWINAGRDRQNIRHLQAQIDQLDKERAQAQAFLDLGANRGTRDQSQFLNGLIQRKAFSWTRVFEDLERVMPANLHLVSLEPKLTEQNELQLEMKVEGDTREGTLELTRHMEASTHFRGAQMTEENGQGESGNSMSAKIVAIYVGGPSERSAK